MTSNNPALSFSDLFANLDAPEATEVAPGSATPESKAVVCLAALEATAQLLRRVQMMWGTRDFDSFVGALFVDSRDGGRKGLPVEVAAELLFLSRLDKMRRALDVAKKLNISTKDAYALIDEQDQGALKIPVGMSPAANTTNLLLLASRKPKHTEDTSRRWKIAFVLLLAVATLTTGILVGLHYAGYHLRISL